MKRSRIWLSVAVSAMLLLAACGTQTGGSAPATDGGDGEAADSVQLQLQWAPQAQFAGYFAAVEQGYYTDENLDVEILDGGPDVVPQQVGSAEDGPEFTISWVPKVLEARAAGSDRSEERRVGKECRSR